MGRFARILIPSILLVTTSPAYADLYIRAKFDDAPDAQTQPLNVTYPGGSFSGGLAGKYEWTWQKTSTNGTTYTATNPPKFVKNGKFSTFCIEVNQHIGFGGVYDYKLVNIKDAPKPGTGQGNGTGNGMGALRASQIQKLFDSSYSNSFTENQYAAFQLAIWEIVFEKNGNPYNVTNGEFKLTGTNTAISNLSAGMISAMNSYVGPKKYELFGLSNPDAQDQIAFCRLPEPGTIMLAISGLAPFAGVLRLRRRLFAANA